MKMQLVTEDKKSTLILKPENDGERHMLEAMIVTSDHTEITQRYTDKYRKEWRLNIEVIHADK